LPPTLPLEASRRPLGGTLPPSSEPWVTILLLGSDAGPGQAGDRTDTMVVAALQRGTGRAVALGVPRNFVEVSVLGIADPPLRRFGQPLNALYAFARTNPELFPTGPDPGATALKLTLSRLLGIRLDYYALVDLEGFADLVDALGGVDIHVKERLVDEVTRPAWGEPKPTIDVVPGRTYHFGGRTALAYVRSRKASDDYTRMARQRCFLSALAAQVDELRVLRHFHSLSRTVEASVRTDIPLSRLPDLVRLAASVDPRQTVTETFGLDYIARRRASDRYPVPDGPAIRAAVRELVLLGPREGRGARSAHAAC
jgi:LCP family protein required for cell wall assembly